MTIARLTPSGLQVLARDRERVRLASTNRKGVLGNKSIQRGMRRSSGSMVACRVSRPRISGLWRRIHFVKPKTLEFLDLASEYFRAQINVISGPEEARLIFQAVAHTQSTEGRFWFLILGWIN